MDYIFQVLIGKYVVVYLDDINVYSKTFDEHLLYLKEVFSQLEKAGLKLKPTKCHFAKQE